jgi:hypothetical protein
MMPDKFAWDASEVPAAGPSGTPPAEEPSCAWATENENRTLRTKNFVNTNKPSLFGNGVTQKGLPLWEIKRNREREVQTEL